MSDIKNLPGAGFGFRVSTGAGNFTKKFTSAIKFGSLKNLSDNKASILKVIKKNERAIKLGKFDRLRQLSAWKAIKSEEGGKLTKDDKREIKSLFKHLSKRRSNVSEVETKSPQMQKAHDNGFESDRVEAARRKINSFGMARNDGRRVGLAPSAQINQINKGALSGDAKTGAIYDNQTSSSSQEITKDKFQNL